MTALASSARWRTRKWDVPDDAVGASIAESDFGTSPAVVRALHDAVDAGFLTYLPAHTARDAEASCAAFLDRRFGWKLEPAQIRLVPDVVEALRVTLRFLVAPHTPVVVPTPCYAPFLQAPRALGRRVVEVPSIERWDGSWEMDLGRIDHELARGGLLILCNPHNPLGQVLDRDQMGRISAVVDAHGARVFSDEIHAPIVYPGRRHVPYASTSPSAAAHTVTATATSKGWNIPGLKTAQLILTADEDRRVWDREDPSPVQSGSILGAIAATAAYGDDDRWLDETVGRFDTNRWRLAELLAQWAPSVRYRVPDATYLAWLDLRGHRLPAASPMRFLAERAAVHTSDGAVCGAVGRGFVRFNFALRPDVLERGVRAIGHVLSPYASTSDEL